MYWKENNFRIVFCLFLNICGIRISPDIGCRFTSHHRETRQTTALRLKCRFFLDEFLYEAFLSNEADLNNCIETISILYSVCVLL